MRQETKGGLCYLEKETAAEGGASSQMRGSMHCGDGARTL